MTIKRSIRALVLAATSLTSATAIILSLPLYSPSFTAIAKTKMVALKVRDDTAFPIQLHCHSREQDVTIEPGKTIALKLAVGDTLVAASSTPHYPAGTIITQISSDMADATISIH